MNDLMHDLSDDDVRDLLARAGADAHAPHGWHEVLERHDQRGQRRRDRRRPWVLAVAAAIVAVGCFGLIVALQARSGERGDRTPIDGPPATVEVPPAVVDPLAALSDGDWVVPSVLPDGYEVIVAMEGLLVGGDDVDEVTISSRASGDEVNDAIDEEAVTATDRAAGSDDARAVEIIDVTGVEWRAQAMIDDDGVLLGHYLQREVNDRVVSLSTRGSLDPLLEIAVGLRPVPDAELDAPRLSFDDGTYTTVAALGDVEVTAQGVNGVYCLRINTPDGTSGGSCGARTEPGTPVASLISLGGPGTTYTAGVAEPDVTRIEFVTSNGTSIVVEPTDVSGTFDNRFWITDVPGAGWASPTIDQAIVTYDDGTTATIQRTPHRPWMLSDDAAASTR